MSEYRELSKEITEYSRRFFNEPEWIVKFVESRLASFALEQRRKDFLEAAERFSKAYYTRDDHLYSGIEIYTFLRALAEQEPSNSSRKGE